MLRPSRAAFDEAGGDREATSELEDRPGRGLLPLAALQPFDAGGDQSSAKPRFEEGSAESASEQSSRTSSELASLGGSLWGSIGSHLSDPGNNLLAEIINEDRVLLVLMLLLGPPVVACALLSLNISALYWIGDIGFSAAAGALLWATVGQVLMHRRILSRRTACVIAVVIPASGLLAAAHMHRTSAAYFSSRLQNKECGTSFHAKHHLQTAWLAAEQIHHQCVIARANVSGHLKPSQVENVMPVSNCPGYEAGLNTWGTEWAYLEALEGSHHCAGWCTFSRKPLWRVFSDKLPHDRCSLAASGVLGGNVYRTSIQVEIYCTAVLFLFILLSLV